MSSPGPARSDTGTRRRPRGRAIASAGDAAAQAAAPGELEFKTALRQVASAVFVLTARVGEETGGLTATSVCPVSSEPPLVLVSVNREATIERLISESGAFAVNFLSDEQHRIARLFTGSDFAPEERFAEGRWQALATGSPVLDGALASFDCLVERQLAHGSHTIFFGRVVASLSLDQECLIYRDGSFRRLAPVV